VLFFVNGQNTRIAEYVEHKLKNSTRPRTCFYDDFTKSIWLVTRRLKNKVETFIPLKCPPIVTKLLIKYCTIVWPVEEHIASHVRGKEAQKLYQEYLWVQNCVVMQKKSMYDAVPDFLGSTINDPIGVHDYRQIVVELSRVFLGSEHEAEQEKIDTLAGQRGHTESTARMRYASEAGHLPGMSSELLLRFGRSSELWWLVSGLTPGAPPLLPLRTRQALLLKPGGKQASVDPNNLPALLDPLKACMQDMFAQMQASMLVELKKMVATFLPNPDQLETRIGHMVSKAIAEGQKNLSMFTSTPPPFPASELPPDTGNDSFNASELQDNHDDIYEDYVEPMQVQPSTIERENPPNVPIVSTEGEPETEPTEETKQYLLHLLAQHFPDEAEPSFKSPQQLRAVELAVARTENFVLIMPTGSGKSLVFTLPPFNEPTFRTYVIVPNKALLHDHIERCRRIGLPSFHWRAHNKGIPDDTQIVFLALETATSETFRM